MTGVIITIHRTFIRQNNVCMVSKMIMHEIITVVVTLTGTNYANYVEQ